MPAPVKTRFAKVIRSIVRQIEDSFHAPYSHRSLTRRSLLTRTRLLESNTSIEWSRSMFSKGRTIRMKKHVSYTLVAGLALATTVWQAGTLEGHSSPSRVETPAVFQAAGPSAESIQSTVDQFRAAIG